jgi:hypothetical protein
MKRKTYNILIILALVLSFAAYGMAAETIAVVLKAKGLVALQRGTGNKATAHKLKRGFRLEHTDKLKTGKKSYAAVRFIDDASLLRIRSNSTCVIRGKKEKNKVLKNIYLEAGVILARVTKQKGKFEISTPTSVASVKGTEWIVEQQIDGGTFYYGLSGVVEVTNEEGTALVHEGETGYVAPGAAPIVRKTKEGEVPQFDEFSENEDFFEFEFENAEGQKKLLEFKSTLEEE